MYTGGKQQLCQVSNRILHIHNRRVLTAQPSACLQSSRDTERNLTYESAATLRVQWLRVGSRPFDQSGVGREYFPNELSFAVNRQATPAPWPLLDAFKAHYPPISFSLARSDAEAISLRWVAGSKLKGWMRSRLVRSVTCPGKERHLCVIGVRVQIATALFAKDRKRRQACFLETAVVVMAEPELAQPPMLPNK